MLPYIGISYEVAHSLEDMLQKQLSLAAQKRLDKLRGIPESQTNSPAESDKGSDEVDSDWEEIMKGARVKLSKF